MIGNQFTHYQVTSKLGQGGMGEVYRATDTRLDREVAIKVLPGTVAQDPERLARFEREAKVLAQLSHPNIASVFGFDEHEGTRFLVMEHVEGEDLSVRLKRGPLSIEETIAVCRQVAEALESAHAKGIIHRDLKPANIKWTADGDVKVLDFGLAKALGDESDSVGLSSHLEGAAEDSPTITDAFTKPGTILGTVAYMSPEQARGKVLDQRTDVWAFGCVLYECLSGQRLFQGEDSTETLAAILRAEPDWSLLPSRIPFLLRRLLRRCLAKDRRDRLHHIADARLELGEIARDPSASHWDLSSEERRSTVVRQALLLGGIVVVAGVALLLDLVYRPEALPSPMPVRQVEMRLGPDGNLRFQEDPFRVSPDGSAVLLNITESDGTGGSKLFLRSLDRLDALEIEETADARRFCFSPPGDWIVYQKMGDPELRKRSLVDGAVVTLCQLEGILGIDWTDDGWLVFSDCDGACLSRVSENGGDVQLLYQAEDDQTQLRTLRALPGGKGLLVTRRTQKDGVISMDVMLYRSADATMEVLLPGANQAQFVAPGILAFVQDDTLFAARFDLERMVIEGQPVPINASLGWSGAFDMTQDGMLVYLNAREASWERQNRLAWIDRRGNRQELFATKSLSSFDLSPDGTQIVYEEQDDSPRRSKRRSGGVEQDEKVSQVKVLDLTTGRHRQLLRSEGGVRGLLWGPAGETILFSIQQEGRYQLFSVPANGSRAESFVHSSEHHIFPHNWHPDGKRLLIDERVPGERTSELKVLTLERNRDLEWRVIQPEDYLEVAPHEIVTACFSPNGNWVVYSDLEASEGHLFISPFPNSGTRDKITIEGLNSYAAMWWPNQYQMVYLCRETRGSRYHQIFRVNYREENGRYLFDEPERWDRGLVGRYYLSLHPDGERALISDSGTKLDHLVLFENFVGLVQQKLQEQ